MSDNSKSPISFKEGLEIAVDQLACLKDYVVSKDFDLYFIEYKLDTEIDGPHGRIFLCSPEDIHILERLLENPQKITASLLFKILTYWLAPDFSIEIEDKEELNDKVEDK